MFDEPIDEALYNRLSAWRASLSHALRCLAVARNQADLLADEDIWTKTSNGQSFRVGPFLESAMVGTAIISFCQIFGSGNKGDWIAGNREQPVNNMRRHLLRSSDTKRGWSEGTALKLVSDLRVKRDKLLAHYDGDAAGLKKEWIEDDGFVIQPRYGTNMGHRANPDFDVRAFEDFDQLVNEIHAILNRYLSGESDLARKNGL